MQRFINGEIELNLGNDEKRETSAKSVYAFLGKVYGEEIFEKRKVARVIRIDKHDKIKPTSIDCGLTCTVEWEKELDGKQHEDSNVTYEALRKKEPVQLVRYFIRTMHLE